MVQKEKKLEMVDWISDRLNRSQIAIATDYRGLTVAQMTELRKRLRKQGVEYHVVKNTLAEFAASKVGKADLSQYLKGPTAIAFGYDDPTQAPKILLEYQKSAEEIPLKIKGGILGSKPITAQEISVLAKLPPREELIAKLVGMLQAPISGLITVLNGNLQGFVGVLQARLKQMGEGV